MGVITVGTLEMNTKTSPEIAKKEVLKDTQVQSK